MNLNATEQMELGLDSKRIAINVKKNRRAQANWWFTKMRQVVDLAWPRPVAAARPEQTYLPLAHKAFRG